MEAILFICGGPALFFGLGFGTCWLFFVRYKVQLARRWEDDADSPAPARRRTSPAAVWEKN